MASDKTASGSEQAAAPMLNMHDDASFDHLLAGAAQESTSGQDNVLLELDVVRADDIEHRFGELAAAALRELLAARLHGVLGGDAPVCHAGHCGLVVLLRGATCDQASELAHRILAVVEDGSFKWHEHPFRLGSHVGVVQLGPSSASPADWRKLSRDVSVYALELGGDGVQVLAYGEQALSHLRGEKAWHEHITEIIA